jgi:hypothetical protein
MMGFEPTTFAMARRRSSQLSYIREAGPSIAFGIDPSTLSAATLAALLGAVAEWLRSGLQSRLHQFDSGRRLGVWNACHPG